MPAATLLVPGTMPSTIVRAVAGFIREMAHATSLNKSE